MEENQQHPWSESINKNTLGDNSFYIEKNNNIDMEWIVLKLNLKNRCRNYFQKNRA